MHMNLLDFFTFQRRTRIFSSESKQAQQWMFTDICNVP